MMEMLWKKEIGTAKVIVGGISFVRCPLSKKVMASSNDEALIRRANTFEGYQEFKGQTASNACGATNQSPQFCYTHWTFILLNKASKNRYICSSKT